MVTEEYVGVSLNLSSKKSQNNVRKTLKFSNRNQLGRNHSIEILLGTFFNIESLRLQFEKSGQVHRQRQKEDNDVGDEPTIGRNISGEIHITVVVVFGKEAIGD